MDIEIQRKRDNKLLDRTEVHFLVHHGSEPTPPRDEVRQALATDLDAQADRIVLHRLRSEFGRGRSEGYAKLYPDVERARDVERAYTLDRNDLAAADAGGSGSQAAAEEPEPEPEAEDAEEATEGTEED